MEPQLSQWKLATKSLRGPIWLYGLRGLPEFAVPHTDPMNGRQRTRGLDLCVDIEYLVDDTDRIVVRNVVPSRCEGNAASSSGMLFRFDGRIPQAIWRPVIAEALENDGALSEIMRSKWGHVMRWRSMRPTNHPACESTMRALEALHAHLPRPVTEAEGRQIIDYLNTHIVSCPYCKVRIPCSEDDCPACRENLDAMRVTIEIG